MARAHLAAALADVFADEGADDDGAADFGVLHLKSALDAAGIPLLRPRFLRHLDLLGDRQPRPLSAQGAWDLLCTQVPRGAACLMGVLCGDPLEEIAARLEVSPTTARRDIARALDLLLVWTAAPSAERMPRTTLRYIARLAVSAPGTPSDPASDPASDAVI